MAAGARQSDAAIALERTHERPPNPAREAEPTVIAQARIDDLERSQPQALGLARLASPAVMIEPQLAPAAAAAAADGGRRR
jgi:hypothetical protein